MSDPAPVMWRVKIVFHDGTSETLVTKESRYHKLRQDWLAWRRQDRVTFHSLDLNTVLDHDFRDIRRILGERILPAKKRTPKAPPQANE